MRPHLVMIAVGLSFATSVAAEPPKAPVRKAEQPAEQAPPVMVAAADPAKDRASDPRQDAATPAKQRRARVTTCRCGDQTPSE